MPDSALPPTLVPPAQALPVQVLPAPPATPVLHVCTTCRAGVEPAEGVPLPGRALHDRLASLASDDMRVVGVECLAICLSGCAASISMPGKWSYLMGRLSPGKAEDIAAFSGAYRRSRTGTVMPSRRAPSLADMVIGRIPPAEQAATVASEQPVTGPGARSAVFPAERVA